MPYFVKVLSALVKVCRRAEDGTPKMRAAGFHPGTGEPLLVPDVRTVNLQKGDPLPDDVADGEIERLLGLDPPAIGQKASVSVMSAPPAGSSAKKSSAKRSSAKKSSSKKKTSSSSKSSATGQASAPDLAKLAELDDASLVEAISGVGAKALVDAVGNDAALAQRVLAAEKTASSDDARTELVDGLEKVIAGDAS